LDSLVEYKKVKPIRKSSVAGRWQFLKISFSIVLLLTLSALFNQACSSGLVEDNTTLLAQAEILQQRQIWQNARAGRGYFIEYRRECFCPPLPARFRVVTNPMNQKILVELIDSNGAVYQQLAPNAMTLEHLNIEDIFDRMLGVWAAQGPLTGQFDPNLGYPIRVFSGDQLPLELQNIGYQIELVQFQ